MINLTPYSAIRSHLFVKIQVAHYKDSANATPVAKTLLFSDYQTQYVVAGDTYGGLGGLMGVTASASELRASATELSITISGIPNYSIAEIIHSRLKGSPVEIRRVLFDPITNTQLAIAGNPVLRFKGFVNNYALDEDYDIQSRQASNTVTLVCSNAVDVLQNKYAGRKTNPASHRRFYPTDAAMDRVPTIEGFDINFGTLL